MINCGKLRELNICIVPTVLSIIVGVEYNGLKSVVKHM